jgi:branched-chain amino acid transport system substrate-binding protein
MKKQILLLIIVVMFSCFYDTNVYAKELIVGLDADMSSGSAKAGKAIYRGIKLAVDEINQNGGLLGSTLKIIVKDHRGNPARGKDNITDFSKMDNLLAVVGGLHTPVVLYELETVHKNNVLFLIPWAAGTPVIKNGYTPNNVFRLSLKDSYAGDILVKEMIKAGYKKPALLLESTAWGKSNENSIKAALKKHNITPVTTQCFFWQETNFDKKIDVIINAGADVIIFVGNSPEGISLVNVIDNMNLQKRLPILSHWGITGGDFFEQTKEKLKNINIKFLQTYSFINPPKKDRANEIKRKYFNTFNDAKTIKDIMAPSGTIHAYELIKLLEIAVKSSSSIELKKVRSALKNINFYDGVIKNYNNPFKNHDALDKSDVHLMKYNENGTIIPAGYHEN